MYECLEMPEGGLPQEPEEGFDKLPEGLGLALPVIFNRRLGLPPMEYMLDAAGRLTEYDEAVWVNPRWSYYGHLMADIRLAPRFCWPGLEVIVSDPGDAVYCVAGEHRDRDRCEGYTQARVLLQKYERIFVAVPVCKACMKPWLRSVSQGLRRLDWQSWVAEEFGIVLTELPEQSVD